MIDSDEETGTCSIEKVFLRFMDRKLKEREKGKDWTSLHVKVTPLFLVGRLSFDYDFILLILFM